MTRSLQDDLFDKPVFESRQASLVMDAARFRSKLKRAMSAAIRECGVSRDAICLEMSRQLGSATVSKAMLNAYTSESKTGHDISLLRFKAFVRATGATSLWDTALSDDGLLVLVGDEARLAEIARLQQEQKALAAKLRKLQAIPVNVKREPK